MGKIAGVIVTNINAGDDFRDTHFIHQPDLCAQVILDRTRGSDRFGNDEFRKGMDQR